MMVFMIFPDKNRRTDVRLIGFILTQAPAFSVGKPKHPSSDKRLQSATSGFSRLD
jgi:hypothetical protein